MTNYSITILIAIVYYIPVLGNQQDQTKEDSVATQAFSGTSNIWLKDGNLYRGHGFSLKQDSIFLFTLIGKQKFNKNQINKISIDSERKSYKNGFAGLYLGVLLGNILLYHEDYSPTAYIDNETDNIFYWLMNIVFAGAGAGAGYLIDQVSDKSTSFDLLENINNWQKVKNLHSSKMAYPGNWHFTIQSAWVYPRIENIYRKPLKENGFSSSDYFYYHYQESSIFNLLRKVQLTYSLNHNFEVGAAIFWQGEREWETYNNVNSTHIRFSNDITGYYAVGIYNLLSFQSTQFINLSLGLALGSANIDFKINMFSWAHGNNNFNHQTKKSLYSQIVFAEILFKPIYEISFGLTADYAETPAQTIPEIPIIDNTQLPQPTQTFIKSEKIKFGNSSIGFIMRINF